MYLVLSLSHSSPSSFRGSSWTVWGVCNGEIWEKVVVVISEITTLEFHCSSIIGLITIGVDFLCHSFLGYINAVSILLRFNHFRWLSLFNFVYRLKSIGNNHAFSSKLPDRWNNSCIPLLYLIEWLIATVKQCRDILFYMLMNRFFWLNTIRNANHPNAYKMIIYTEITKPPLYH